MVVLVHVGYIEQTSIHLTSTSSMLDGMKSQDLPFVVCDVWNDTVTLQEDLGKQFHQIRRRLLRHHLTGGAVKANHP